jgi:signal transduction histidine kinase
VAAGHRQHTDQPIQLSEAPAALAVLETWVRTLQQALQLEVDRGFADLMGRQERFSAFLSRNLRHPPEVALQLPGARLLQGGQQQRLAAASAGSTSTTGVSGCSLRHRPPRPGCGC